MDASQNTPAPQAPIPHTPPAKAPVPRQIYEIDGKDRLLLPFTLALGVLAADLAVFSLRDFPALGITALAALWYVIFFWYAGPRTVLRTRDSRLLFLAAALLAASFALFSNRWLRGWNLLALPLLMTLQVFGAAGGARQPWSAPGMVPERIALLFSGFFTRLDAAGQAVTSLKKHTSRRSLWILAGIGTAGVLIAILLPLLTSADAFFRYITGGAATWLALHVPGWTLRGVLGLCAAPFLFSLLYTLRRPAARTAAGKTRTAPAVDAAAPIIVLAALDLLYVFFLAVQLTALFGGERYLAQAGLTYAEYARSGFFQLVFAAVLNLTVLMLCLRLSRGAERGRRAVQILAAGLVALSAVLLVSAAGRMTLYVLAYGLSFKRLLTYWGMALLAVLLAAAMAAIWKPGFSFFRVCLTAGIAGWLILNFMNPDYLVASCNVSLSLRDPHVQVDISYMTDSLSYDALPALERLSDAQPGTMGLSRSIALKRGQAEAEASHWESWSLSAQLAAAARVSARTK